MRLQIHGIAHEPFGSVNTVRSFGRVGSVRVLTGWLRQQRFTDVPARCNAGGSGECGTRRVLDVFIKEVMLTELALQRY